MLKCNKSGKNNNHSSSNNVEFLKRLNIREHSPVIGNKEFKA